MELNSLEMLYISMGIIYVGGGLVLYLVKQPYVYHRQFWLLFQVPRIDLWLPKTSYILTSLTFLPWLSYGPGMRTIPVWSNNSCNLLIAGFDQSAKAFPASNGRVTRILLRLLSNSSVPREYARCEVPWRCCSQITIVIPKDQTPAGLLLSYRR